jgi:membrane-associated phospholipid phosphatase
MTVVAKLTVVSILVGLFYYISSNIEVHEKAGMDVIMWVQGMRSAHMDILMRFFTVFGFEFFFVLIPLLAWWGDPKYQKMGASLFTLLLLVLFSVSLLKATFTRPRPFVINSNIADPSSHPDKIEFSYPSGHAWASTSFFFLAKSMQHLVYWVVALVLSAITLFSRVYFGVHYPHDLAAGVTCGIILLILFTFLERFLDHLFALADLPFEADDGKGRLLSSHTRKKLFNSANAAAVVLLMCSTAVNFIISEEIKAKQQGIIFVPFCLLGLMLCRPFIPKMYCTSFKYRMIRMVVGVPIIFSFYFLHRLGGRAWTPLIATCVGGWIFCVAPLVFLKLHLVRPDSVNNKQHVGSWMPRKQD